MKRVFIAAALLAGTFATTEVNAMPSVAFAKTPSAVTQVDYACGRGFHETRWGHCRPNGWDRPHWDERRPAYWGHHRPPPPEWHRHHRYYGDY